MQEPSAGHVSAAPADKQRSQTFVEQWCAERGLRADAGTLEPHPFNVRAFRFINYDAAGNRRVDLSTSRFDREENKYISPKGGGSIIYAPRPDSLKRWNDAEEVWLAEGEGKTLALAQLGLVVLGVRGCVSWHLARSKDLHPVLTERVKPGKRINIVFDADWNTNRAVHRGLYDCMEAVRRVGGVPVAVVVPPILGLKNTGIDDLLKMYADSGIDPLRALANLPRLDQIPNPYVVDLKKPYDTAENFAASEYPDGQFAHWQDDFYVWHGAGWRRHADELVQEELYEWVRRAGATPTKTHINNLLHALRSAAQIRVRDVPAWLSAAREQTELLPLANGLLNPVTLELHPSTPEYFNLSWASVDYDAAATCTRWLRFLEEVYPDDPTSCDTLQEFVGYCLTTDTSQQKAIMLIGPKRSGKGTITHVVQALLGSDSYCAPTLQSLGETFGLQTWIGKRAAFVSDARASARNNSQALVERVLTITGEDAQYVNRKNKDPWEGHLHARLWVLSNQLPATHDTGAALVSRFLVLQHSVSFYGQENTNLKVELVAELPGILNWALAGLRRLRERGNFVQPDSGKEKMRQWERLNSPMLGFVEDCCVVAPGQWVTKSALRLAHARWCMDHGIERTLDDSHFTNELNSATNDAVKVAQRTVDGKRERIFKGVGLVAPAAAQPAQPKY